jgi:hypothetical protein
MYHPTATRRAKVIEESRRKEREESRRKEREKLVAALEGSTVKPSPESRLRRIDDDYDDGWNAAIYRAIKVVNEELR